MSYELTGYELIDISSINEALIKLRAHCFKVFDSFSCFHSGKSVLNDNDLIQFRANYQIHQYQALKQLQFCPQLFTISGHEFFPNLLVSKYKFKLPNLELPPYMRCDIPIKEQSLFKQHQDYSYNIGSSNSVTIWIPLQDTNVNEGALLAAPNSHKNGVYENTNGIIDEIYKFDFIPVPVKFGQALIFDQKIVHKSGFNSSAITRFSVILRFSDLGDEGFLERGCPVNHEITTTKYA